MAIDQRLIVNLSVFNSYKNLKKIIAGISAIKLNIVKIIIVDNNSSISIKKKLALLIKLKNLYKINIKLVVNNENYGFGGSQKILFSLLKKEKFEYLIALGTSNRYNIRPVMLAVKKNIKFKKDYYLFSRFVNRESTRNYNRVRRDFNIIFIIITKIFTATFFSDPGQSSYILKKKILNKFKNIKVNNITNGSHFPHFFNIKMFKLNLRYKEIPIMWKEGNIKSHLQPLNYVLIFSLSIIKYFLTGEFFIEKKNNFKFKIYNIK